MHHNNGFMPDVQGLLLVAGSGITSVFLNISDATKVGLPAHVFVMFMTALSMVLTCLAIIDYSMKIQWKVKERNRIKEHGHGLSDRDMHLIKELIKELKHTEAEVPATTPIGFKH